MLSPWEILKTDCSTPGSAAHYQVLDTNNNLKACQQLIAYFFSFSFLKKHVSSNQKRSFKAIENKLNRDRIILTQSQPNLKIIKF